MGDSRVVVDDCVEVADAGMWLMVVGAGHVGRRMPVPGASRASEELVPTTVGDTAGLGDVHVNQ